MFDENIVVSKTPLRVSFVGGGTDMPYFFNRFPGATVSCTINKYIYVTAKYHNNFQEKYRLNYSETENVRSISEIKNLRIKEVIKILKIKKPLYINTFADIPSNSGLGSSSSFTVGLITALCKLEQKIFSKKKIADLAFKIESKITDNSIGKQDHYIASYGGFNYIQYKKNQTFVTPLILKKNKINYLFNSLVLVWTEKNRSAVNILKDQQKNIKKNFSNLKLYNKFTKDFFEQIKRNDFKVKKIAKLISETWILKKKFSNLITNRQIDKIYSQIKKNTYGGKLLGAGNGGFFMIFFDFKKKKEVFRSLKKYKYLRVALEKNGSTII
jgi:D-glycero-alpha-D-manno-heptose-7-phosphate kinase